MAYLLQSLYRRSTSIASVTYSAHCHLEDIPNRALVYLIEHTLALATIITIDLFDWHTSCNRYRVTRTLSEGAIMQSQITLNGRTYQYTSSTITRNGTLVYQGTVTLTVLKAIASAVK